MRVATFNIHHGTVGRRGPVDPERLGAACASLRADVVCLQEVDEGTWRSGGADLAGAAAAAAGMAVAFGPSRRFPGGRYGNAVLVRGDLVGADLIRLPRVPASHRWQEQRTALAVGVVVDGTSLEVVCTHLAVPTAVNGPQLGHLLDVLARRTRSGPLVVAGDLNRRRADVVPLAAAHDLDVAAHGPSFPARRPRLDIDHVLVSSEVEVVRAEVRRTPMSDHAALVVDLEIEA